MKDIPLSSIYDFDVRWEVLGTASIEGKSIHELIRVVEATEAARDTVGGSRPATTAASSPYKMALQTRRRQQTAANPTPVIRHASSETDLRVQ